MKTSESQGVYGIINAIQLCNGFRVYINNMELVTPLDAELIIKGVKK